MITKAMPIYLDCAATSPLDPRVRDAMFQCFDAEFGNAGSRTHAWGQRARQAVEHARDQVAAVVAARRGDVIFTSGATESNNLAILGLASAGEGRGHIVTTAIEHHAVLEPIAELRRRGFEVTEVLPDASGRVDADQIAGAMRSDTRLVAVMHVNNETGVVQPIAEIADRLPAAGPYLLVDAAQGFAREVDTLRHARIDFISASAHKIGGPKGVGALVARRREGGRPPLRPLMFGGGQERGLRPGTLPVPLIVGFGLAAELAITERAERAARGEAFRASLLSGLAPLGGIANGDVSRSVPYILNLSFPAIAADVAIEAWRDLVAVSHGAACSSHTRTCSHVLAAMRLPAWRTDAAIRFSWCHDTPRPDWAALVKAIEPRRREPEEVAGA